MIIREKIFIAALCLAVWSINPARAENSPQRDQPAAIVSATATGEFKFDEARISFSFNYEGQDVADLTEKLAKKAAALIEAMKSQALSDADISASGPTISVRYATIRNVNGPETIDRQRIDGYSGFISITGRFKDFTRLGTSVSDGVKLGATISGPSFALSTSNDKLASLAVDATRTALANARAMIEATGRKAGRILEIRAENSIQPMIDQPLRAMAFSAPAGDIQIPVSPGRVTLSKSVTVTLEIVEP